MHSKGNAPTAEQKRWREDVRALGCIITGVVVCEIHHCRGATFKHNKVPIGHWFILPLHPELHRTGQLNVTDHKHRWEEVYGTQVELFMQVVQRYEQQHDRAAPVPPEVISAILDLDWKNAA